MVTLDATKVKELPETDAASVGPLPAGTRRITIPMTDDCETSVVLYFLKQQHFDGDTIPAKELPPVWIPGFRVERRYDCEPFDSIHEELPDPDVTEEGVYENLGDAVVAAAENASWWITTNTGDTVGADPQGFAADMAMDDWKSELEPETITESIFDDATDTETNAAADGPAAGVEKPTTPSEPSPTDPPAAADATPDAEPKDTTMVITDEAQEHFGKRRHNIEAVLCQLVIREAELKNSLKSCRDSIKLQREELENHLARGPERLPLFELQAREKAKQEAAKPAAAIEPSSDEEDKPGDARVEQRPYTDADGEPWRSVKIADMDGLTPKIIEILDAERITTVGEWVDWPKNHPGLEYTQIKTAAGGITEARYTKIVAAMDAVTCERVN